MVQSSISVIVTGYRLYKKIDKFLLLKTFFQRTAPRFSCVKKLRFFFLGSSVCAGRGGAEAQKSKLLIHVRRTMADGRSIRYNLGPVRPAMFTSLRLRYYPAVHETAVACRACLFGLFPRPSRGERLAAKENVERRRQSKIYVT